jgi:hypothetical protein
MTSTLWLDGLITRAIKETYAYQCRLLSPQVQAVLSPLMNLGDPIVVWKVTEALTGPVWVRRLLALVRRVPLQTLLAAEQDLPGIQRHLCHVKDMLGDPEVADYSPGMLAEHLAREMIYEQEAVSIMAPIMEAWEQITTEDSLLILLDPFPRNPGDGAPLRPSTVFMILLANHLQIRTGRQHYREIAEVATILFGRVFYAKQAKDTYTYHKERLDFDVIWHDIMEKI